MKGSSTMAEQFNQKNVDEALNFLSELKARAKQASDQENVFMMSLYRDLIKAVSPIVSKAHTRLLREDNAKINAAHRDLREKAAAERKQEREEKARAKQP